MKIKAELTNLGVDLYRKIKKSKINASKVCSQILTTAVELVEQHPELIPPPSRKTKRRFSFFVDEELYRRVKALKIGITLICRRSLARAVRVLENSP